MLIQDIVPIKKGGGKQVSYLPKSRQVKKASKRALPVLLIAFLIIQIVAGPFVPFKFSQNPPRISLQEARAVGTPIATCAELQNMNNDLTASYYLTNDIDCSDTTTWNSGQGFIPIGYYEAVTWNEFPFTGSFDGQGYKITSLYMSWVEIDGVYIGGFFGYAKDATIENVGLENVNITIQHSEWGAAGTLMGYAEGNSTVSNSYSTGSVSGVEDVGGLIGYNEGTVSSSYFTGSISGTKYVGGLIGETHSGAVSNSYSTGSVSGSSTCVGGLIGRGYDDAISDSYSTSSVNGTDYVGGLIGLLSSGTSTISNSYSTGSVSGSSNVGGLVGYNPGTMSSYSFWDTETSGQATSAGGIGKTTAEMKNVRAFTDTAAPWDFVGDPHWDVGTEDIWNIDNTGEKNNGYPFLSWQNTSPNIPTLVLPANNSFTADDTPALSAVYSDSDNGDTGTTNYRIATSSANCLAGTVVASGTSAATSSNNATTTWTPSSLIGDDGTYHWCAQNNDGVATSSWTAMGNFTLDATGPTGSIANASGNPTNDTTPILNLSIADTGVGITNAQMRFSCDDSNWSSWENYATPKTDFNIRTGAGCADTDGNKTAYVQFKDSLENEGSSYNTGSFVLDTAGPTVSLSTPANNSSTGDNTPTLAWSGSDATSGIAKYQLYIDSSLDTDNISSSATSTTPTNSLSCGVRTWHIRAYDNADNYTDSSTFNLTMNCGSSLPTTAFNQPIQPEPTPENPEGGFSVLINNNDEYTDDETVILKLSAGKDTKRMAISNTEDFKYASQIPYQEEYQWELSSGRDEAVPRLYDGEYTVYAKFYTQYGVASEVVLDSIILKTATAETEEQTEGSNEEEPASEIEGIKDPESTNDSEPNKDTTAEDNKPATIIFTKTLSSGSNDNQVTQLQNKLKELNFFPKEIESNNSFNLTTKNAVKEYQTSKEIYPCGIVGPRTRKALNNEEFITNKDYQFTKDLKYNDKNEEVKQLQTRLRDQNFFPHNVESTGWFGSITQGAVNIFQKFYGLVQSGVVDEGMKGVLNR